MLKIVIYQNKGLVTVGWGTGVEANLKLKNVEYPLYILLLTIRWFDYQCDLWNHAHINTIAIDFLNGSGCFFVVSQSH